MLKYNYLLVGGEGAYRNFTRKNVDEHSQKMGALFIQDEFSPVEQLRVLGAVRLDMVEDLDPVVTPKLSLLYRPLDPIRLRCSVGRGFRAPTVQDLHEKYYGHDPYYRDGNPDLLPEYSTNVTGGVEYVPLTGLNLMLNGYYNDITDMITPVTHGDTLIPSISADSILVYRRENVHEAFVAGFELACSWRFLERFRLDGGFSLIHNENRETGASLPYYPGKTAFARASVTQPVTSWLKMNAFAGVKATMDRETWQYQTEETIALADYQKVDLGLGMTVGDRYEVYFAVDNALAQELEMYEDKLLVTEGERFYRWGLRASVY
jgi:outer membrane receptor for ferrienterochelin and colicins